MKKVIIAVTLAAYISAVCSVFAEGNFSYEESSFKPLSEGNYVQEPVQTPQNNTLRGSVIMIPAGTQLKAALTTPLSSEFVSVGQNVTLALNSNFYYDDKLIAPAGSTVSGMVIEAQKAKRATIPGKLCVRFNRIYTPYGTQIPISAVIKTDDNTGVLSGGTKIEMTKDYAIDIASGSAAGALSGLVFGALAGGSPAKGAALGTAVGAGGGLAKSFWDKGSDVEIPTGATIDLILTQPITVSSTSYNNEN